ncbi:MAG: hypothetical protein AAF773_00810 [Cyanobacteria bacterium P01_D01_bin.115]
MLTKQPNYFLEIYEALLKRTREGVPVLNVWVSRSVADELNYDFCSSFQGYPTCLVKGMGAVFKIEPFEIKFDSVTEILSEAEPMLDLLINQSSSVSLRHDAVHCWSRNPKPRMFVCTRSRLGGTNINVQDWCS